MNGWQEYLKFIEDRGYPFTDSLMIPGLIVQCWTEDDASIVEATEELELIVVELGIGSYHVWEYDFFPESFLEFKTSCGEEHFWVMSPHYYNKYVKGTAIHHCQ